LTEKLADWSGYQAISSCESGKLASSATYRTRPNPARSCASRSCSPLAGDDPKAAFDAFIGRLRQTIGCVAEGYAYGSGYEVDALNAVAFKPFGQHVAAPAVLRTTDGRRDLVLNIRHQYTVVHIPQDRDRGPYKVKTRSYSYELLDRAENEVLLYHWHPEGISNEDGPHLHVPCARNLWLPASDPSGTEGRHVAFNKLHLPTGRVLLEDVVELLILGFDIDPLRDDWRSVLDENRAAFHRGRTWALRHEESGR